VGKELNSLLTDFVFALRLVRKAPLFTATVVAVLALGVGANTAVFSVIHGALLHPFPYADSEKIVFIASTPRQGNGQMSVTYPDYLEFRKQARTLDYIAFATNRDLTLTGVKQPASLKGAVVSAPVWPLLGVPAMLGRTFTDAEDRPGAAPVCVIGTSMWKDKLDADPNILGKQVMLDGKSYTVVGVMPRRFKFWAGEVWIPAGLEADTEIMRSRVLRLNTWAVGKLAPAVSLQQANAELEVIAKRIGDQYPDTNKNVGARASLLTNNTTGSIRGALYMLLGAVGFVLLIACANVANLLLARANARSREFAIRASLGAGRGRLIRQVLLECVPLAVLGAGSGILVGAWGLRGLLAILPEDGIPAEAAISVNVPVMLFSFVACMVTMLLFALLPALDVAHGRLTEALQEGGRGTGGPRASRVRSSLIVGEVALSLVLLVGAGLLIRSFGRLQAVKPGFDPSRLLVLTIKLPRSGYPSGLQATRFFEEIVGRAKLLPGVQSVAASSNVPLLGSGGMPLLTRNGTYSSLKDLKGVQFSAVTADYFSAQGIRLAKGRTFTEGDRAGSEPVIILNEAAVKQFLGGKDPLGESVMLGLPDNLNKPGLLPKGLDTFHWSRVVGVVQNVLQFGLDSEPRPAAYMPVEQTWDSDIFRNTMFVLVRTVGDPVQSASGMRSIVAAVDPSQPIQAIATMESTIVDSLRQSRFSTVLLGIFAAVASTLAAVGIYGVVSWNVTQRTRELGIRTALGATPSAIVLLVVGSGMRAILIGLAIGFAGSLALTRLIGNMLFETSAFDIGTFMAAGAGLSAVALLASLLPARRASKIDPIVSLRAD
jgi:putative ABC transport system permease protein